MRKINFFLFLFLVLGIKSQVTIGSNEIPIKGAILDLKERSDGTSSKGMILPRVKLKALNQLLDPSHGKSEHMGLLVYNVDDACVNKGVYSWSGEVWDALYQEGVKLEGSREKDSLALVKLYNSTNGASWSIKSGWLSNQPLEQWHGVTTQGLDISCGNGGRVVKLDLKNNNLDGTLPSDIGVLGGLTDLYLHENKIKGSIPSEITNLVELRYLDLHQNQLSSTIPPSIGNMIYLKYLSLQKNVLTGSLPLEIGKLESLQNLELGQNQLDGVIPSEIGNLVNLQYLRLNENKLTGNIPASLKNLTILKGVELNNNRLSGYIPDVLLGVTNKNFCPQYLDDVNPNTNPWSNYTCP